MEITETMIETAHTEVEYGTTRPEDQIQEALQAHGSGAADGDKDCATPVQGTTEGQSAGEGEGKEQGQGEAQGEAQEGEGQGEGQPTPADSDQSQGEGQDLSPEMLEQALSGLSEDQKQEFLQSLGEDPSRTWTEEEIRKLAYAVYAEEFSGAAEELELLAQRMRNRLSTDLQTQEESLWERIKEELGEIKRVRGKAMRVELKDGTIKHLGLVHKETAWILKALQRPRNLFLTGPAGSGKTTAAEKAAEALGLSFYPISVGPETMKSDLLGFIDGNGHYHTTPVREAFEKGGLLLLDEMDAGNGASLTILNSLLANGYCSFPDGVIHKHPSFRCIAAANTFGRGADRQYVGRNQLDAATLDRFAVRAFDYDEDFERRLAGNDAWVDRVQAIRHAAAELKLRVVVSPRASIVGAGMLEDGFSQKDVEEALIFKYDESFRRKMQERGL